MAWKCVRAALAAGCLAALAGGSVSLAAATGSAREGNGQAAPAADGAGTPDFLDRVLEQSDQQAAAAGEDAGARRSRLLARIATGDKCFVGDPTPEQLARIAAVYGGRNPSEKAVRFAPRFFLNGSAWDGSGQRVAVDDDARRARPAFLTFSFPADGTEFFYSDDATGMIVTAPNDLNARLSQRFGANIPDYGFELFRQVLAQWQRNAGLRYRQVCDDNTRLNADPAPLSPLDGARGDIRIGSVPQGINSGVLAFNFYPEFGGDMVLNSDYFTPSRYYASSNGYRFLRNAASHEHGHGLGLRHSLPCNQTKLMEPFSSTAYDSAQVDDKRGAQVLYGDRFSGNQSPETARELGLVVFVPPRTDPNSQPLPQLLTPPLDAADPSPVTNPADPMYPPHPRFQPHSVLERDLSTNGAWTETNPSGADWFTFSVERAETVSFTVTQTGLSYLNYPQRGLDPSGGSVDPCAPPEGANFEPIDTSRAGHLQLEVYGADATGTTPGDLAFPAVASDLTLNPPVAQIAGDGAGVTLAPGRYWIRVRDLGRDGGPIMIGDQPQPTQLYNLEVRFGASTDFPTLNRVQPIAMAGVDRIARVGEVSQFIGDLGSRVQEAQTSPLNTASYEWDLDGDGIFEINAASLSQMPPISPRTPTITYTGASRLIPVTLRVTDANGVFTQDSILVRVIGPAATVTGITPPSGAQGTTGVYTITGTGLGGIISPAQIGFSGTGVRVVGVQVPASDTQVTVFVQVDASAALGLRNLIVGDGCSPPVTLTGAFEVTAMPVTVTNDACAAAAPWAGGFGACNNFDNRGATDEIGATSCGTPAAPLNNDVWYTWTVPMLPGGVMDPVPVRVSIPTASFPTRAQVFRGTCPPDSATGALACATSLSGGQANLLLNQGETILVRVGSIAAAQTGTGCVRFETAQEPIGSCCTADTAGGAMPCAVKFRSRCAAPSVFTAGGVCAPSPCPPVGACCAGGGVCAITFQAACSASATWIPGPQACSPTACQPPMLACCFPTGDCTFGTSMQCANSNGSAQTAGSTCTPNPCPQPPIGRCCVPSGSCSLVTAAQCQIAGGAFDGATLSCDPNTCPQPVMACCTSSGACTTATSQDCSASNGTPNMSSTCTPNPCPPPPAGRCCVASGACSVGTAPQCTGLGGAFTVSGTCTPNPCPQPTFQCCRPDGACVLATTTDCAAGNGVPNTSNTTCTPNACPPPTGACCAANGACQLLSQAACTTAAGTFRPADLTCGPPNPCPQPMGGCCRPGQVCQTTIQVDCIGPGFRWTAGLMCSPIACNFTGACCTGTVCTVTQMASCVSPAIYQGDGVACGPAANPTICCPANFNHVDGLTVQDIFDFLAAYFGPGLAGDFNQDGQVSIDDVFAFLRAYFAGCGPTSGQGACCTGSACTLVDPGACSGRFLGAGAVCEGDATNPITCCPANVDRLGGLGVQDIFFYLQHYFVQDPIADFNADGSVTLTDLLAFLQAYFVGC